MPNQSVLSQVRRGGDRETIVIPRENKQNVAGASSPIAILPPTLPPDYTHHHHQIIHPTQHGVRMLPPKVPPKPVMVPPAATDNAMPEAQPLLPHCGMPKPNPATQQQTQEMPVWMEYWGCIVTGVGLRIVCIFLHIIFKRVYNVLHQLRATDVFWWEKYVKGWGVFRGMDLKEVSVYLLSCGIFVFVGVGVFLYIEVRSWRKSEIICDLWKKGSLNPILWPKRTSIINKLGFKTLKFVSSKDLRKLQTIISRISHKTTTLYII